MFCIGNIELGSDGNLFYFLPKKHDRSHFFCKVYFNQAEEEKKNGDHMEG